MTTAIESAARAAAKWWRSKINAPKNNGDRSRQGDMSNLLATIATDYVPAAAADKFEEALFAQVVEKIRARHERVWFTLGVDYGPDRELNDALVAAGLKSGLTSPLPWKTNMWVASDAAGKLFVAVRGGYGAQSIDIWKEEGAVTTNERAAAKEVKRRMGECICDPMPNWEGKTESDWSCLVEGHGKCSCASGKESCSMHYNLVAAT